MKISYQRAADLGVVVASIVLSIAVIQRAYFTAPAVSAREDVVPVGATLIQPHAGKIVLIFLSPSCKFCAASMPFYRTIATTRQRMAVSLIVQSMDSRESVLQYLQHNSLAADLVEQHGPPPGARGTPTLVLLDAHGRALKSWTGELSKAQERTFFDLLKS